MCLRIRGFRKNGSHIKIAKKDILVYKNLLQYGPNQLRKTPYRSHLVESPILDVDDFTIFKDTYYCATYWVVGRGIHAYTDYTVAYRRRYANKNEYIHEAWIPAGTKYIVGQNGDIVSLCLIIGESIIIGQGN